MASRSAPASPKRRRRPAEVRAHAPPAAGVVVAPPQASSRKQLTAPVWQAGPAGSTVTSTVSWSQSRPEGQHALHVAAGAALVPELLPAAAPEMRLAGRQRGSQGLLAGVGDHEHLAAVRGLDHAGHQAVRVVADELEEGGVVHGEVSAPRQARHSFMMATPALVPTLTAPALTMRSTSAAVRMPPEALTPMCASRQSRSSSTSSTVAPVRAQTRRRLDEVDAGLLADVTGEPLELVVEVAGLDDRLDDHLPAPGVDPAHAHLVHDGGELVAHQPELAREERRHVDDDVHLVGARAAPPRRRPAP